MKFLTAHFPDSKSERANVCVAQLFVDQGMPPSLLELLRVVQIGASTNLWGLACPFYCTQPSLGIVFAVGLFGTILGFAFGIWTAFTFLTGSSRGWGFGSQGEQTSDQVPEDRGQRRLRGYLYGRAA